MYSLESPQRDDSNEYTTYHYCPEDLKKIPWIIAICLLTLCYDKSHWLELPITQTDFPWLKVRFKLLKFDCMFFVEKKEKYPCFSDENIAMNQFFMPLSWSEGGYIVWPFIIHLPASVLLCAHPSNTLYSTVRVLATPLRVFKLMVWNLHYSMDIAEHVHKG